MRVCLNRQSKAEILLALKAVPANNILQGVEIISRLETSD